jgi:hypothetical protein
MNKIATFDYWVQKVIPAVYDDSLSYYELLAKVVKQLNDMGITVNELIDLYEQMTDYVNNQMSIEVIKKLDDMVADGTFDTFINGTVFQGFNDRLEVVEEKTNYVVHLNQEIGFDPTGNTSSAAALTSAFSKGNIVKLPDNSTTLINQTFILDGGKEIHGMGRDTIIKLGADVTLFDIVSSAIVLKNLRILVPAANTKPVIKVTPKQGAVVKYIDLQDVYIEGIAANGNWIGLQWDMSVGFLLYRSKFKMAIDYAKIGLHLIGGGGVTGVDVDCDISGFENGMKFEGTTDSFQNNRFRGELQNLREGVNTNGVHMLRGWGNRFEMNCWYDNQQGQFTDYRFEAATYNNRVEGHMEGRYVDLSGKNLFNATLYKWDFTTTPKAQSGSGDFRDILDNRDPAPVNLLNNPTFTIGSNAGWSNGFPTRAAMERDTATFGYTVMKLRSLGTVIGWVNQQIKDFTALKGKTIHLGCWVYVSSGSTGDRVSGISIQDGVTASYSELVPKNGKWNWVTVKHTVSNDATGLYAELGRVNATLNKVSTAEDVIFFYNPVMLVGGIIRPHQDYPTRRLLKYTPPTQNDSGKEGDTCYDDNYMYIWTADNVIKRVAIAGWV